MKKQPLELPTTAELEQELHRVRYHQRYKTVLKSTVYTLITVAAVAVLVATLWLPVLALGVTAGAADPAPVSASYTVTINNKTDGHTYEAYQIFAGDLQGKVLSNITWGDGITEAGRTALKDHYTLAADDTAADVESYKTYKVVFHDTLSAGLTYNGDAKVTVDGTDKTTNFTITNDNGKLTVSCDDVIALGAKNGSTIVVTYTAKLNEKAAIGATGNPNEVYLEFSNNPNGTDTGKTPADKVRVFTYQLEVNKVDSGKKPLKGAGFTLYKKGSDGNYAAVGAELKSEELTTFTWKGLDDGEYKLVETTTPAGYNTIADIEFKITAVHEAESADPQLKELNEGDSVFTGTVETGLVKTDVVNNAGSTLPETGGAGIRPIYGLGVVLLLTSALLLYRKKRT